MKIMSVFPIVSVLFGLLLALSTPASAADFVNVLTGGTSGVYYPLGVALANDVCLMPAPRPNARPRPPRWSRGRWCKTTYLILHCSATGNFS